MKSKTLILTLATALLFLSACSLLKNNSQSTQQTAQAQSDPILMGKYAGAAIDQLYGQYQIDKKIDFTNFHNIASLLNLTGAARELKNNRSNKEYRSNFALGLVMGSLNITEDNSLDVTDKITDIVDDNAINDLEEAVKNGEADASQVKEISDNVTDIIDIIKKK